MSKTGPLQPSAARRITVQKCIQLAELVTNSPPTPFFTCPNGPRFAAVRASEWLNPQLGAPPHFSHLRANYLIGRGDFDVGGCEFVIVFAPLPLPLLGKRGRDLLAAENGPSF